jgi:hypothetical protein
MCEIWTDEKQIHPTGFYERRAHSAFELDRLRILVERQDVSALK